MIPQLLTAVALLCQVTGSDGTRTIGKSTYETIRKEQLVCQKRLIECAENATVASAGVAKCVKETQ